MSLVADIKNKLYNSSGFKAISGQDWLSTPYGSDFMPEYIVTDGQKRFSTNASIPNLPKVETMFFVYFSLNPQAQAMINKRRALIEYLTKIAAQNQVSTDTATTEQNKQNAKKSNNLIEYVSNTIDKGVTELSNSFQNAKKEVGNLISGALGINTQGDIKTSADYIPDKFILRQLAFELSKFVKTIDKPSFKNSIKTYNEYNRIRKVIEKTEYNPIKITFYDVKENPVQQFFFSYLKLISDDFLCKDKENFRKTNPTNKWDTDPTDWGVNTDSNFKLIDSISIIEFYMDRMMVYTLENPVLESVNFGSNKLGSFAPNEITVTFQYEYMSNDGFDFQPYTNALVESNPDDNKAYLKSMINSKINPDIATFLNMRYKEGISFGLDNAVSFIKGILDTPSDERWSKFKSQILDTGRKLGFANEINSVIKAGETIDNFKNSEDKGKYILKVVDDPSSIIGTLTASNKTTAANSILNLF